jgi:hypothetical protein
MLVKDNLLVIRMDVAGLTQWGSSWGRERACGRGGIRKNCGNLWKSARGSSQRFRSWKKPGKAHWGEGQKPCRPATWRLKVLKVKSQKLEVKAPEKTRQGPHCSSLANATSREAIGLFENPARR